MSLLKVAGTTASSGTLYVDDVFSTWLYTGTGAAQTITNGIDLAGKGGMTWIKSRSAATDHKLTDTVRGATKALISDTTGAETTDTTGLTAFSSTGFSLGANSVYNTNAATYATYSFCKKSNFFDVQTVTHTNGTANNINLSVLGTLGMVIAKITTTTGDWDVWHRSLTAGNNFQLNTTSPQSTTNAWLSVSGTTATLSASAPTGTYVIYGYAHDTSSTGIIQCGLITTDASGVGSTTLGWEPQFIFTKSVSANSSSSFVTSSMQGMSLTGSNWFYADTASAEQVTSPSSYWTPNATGFSIAGHPVSSSIVYMAIRRPNKPPTDATKVFSPTLGVPSASPNTVTTGFPVDTVLSFTNSNPVVGALSNDRLRGSSTTRSTYVITALPELEGGGISGFGLDNNTAIVDSFSNSNVGVTTTTTYWCFRRAPNFFDEVCYTGTGSATTQAHNLTVVPELIIVKERSATNNWWVYDAIDGNTKYSVLNSTAIPVTSSTAWNNTTPTASVFSIGTGANVNASAKTFVAYLFATLAGISKVGSYTGNGTGQAIACGFGSGGARFVLIKRTDSTSNWYCFDSANGLTSSVSPYTTWNTAVAQTTGNNGVYASSGGFTLGATAITTTNIATASYIFLAVA